MTGPSQPSPLRQIWSGTVEGGPWRPDEPVVEAMRTARWGAAPRAVRAVTVMGLAVVALLTARWLMAQRDASPHVVAPAVAVAATGTSTGPTGSNPASPRQESLAGPSTSMASPVTVHVVGAVRQPGLVRLPAGARVADAVDAAGGPAAQADLRGVNLARALLDGEQVVVPTPGEVLTGPTPPPGLAPSPTASSGGPVNLNTGTLSDIESLPGVGPVLAQRILDWRSQHGRFSSVDELSEVSGIGEKMLENIRPHVVL